LARWQRLPLAGVTVAVKDNIDVAGIPTTAGCPAYAYRRKQDAASVRALRRAGALIIGKTNLDQFATGLTGTRSPYGVVRDARQPELISGGSSSGSAVAVALGLCDLGLATDTAGSGRVPAAFQGIVGAKPARGQLSTAGVVPACRSFDCVSVLAQDPTLAQSALVALGGRRLAARPLGRPPRLAVVGEEELGPLDQAGRQAYLAAVERVKEQGARCGEISLRPFLAAGRLLYGAAFVVERYVAVGSFIAANPSLVHPVVAEIILAAKTITAAAYAADWERLRRLRGEALAAPAGYDALLLPTAPGQPTVAEVLADPVKTNEQLGYYTTFANPLAMAAWVLPAGTAAGRRFGVMLLGAGGKEGALAAVALRLAPVLGGEGSCLS